MNKKDPKKIYVIRYGGSGFYMTGPGGDLWEKMTPRQLAKIAWAKDADEVVFDFDLNLDPDK